MMITTLITNHCDLRKLLCNIEIYAEESICLLCLTEETECENLASQRNKITVDYNPEYGINQNKLDVLMKPSHQ